MRFKYSASEVCIVKRVSTIILALLVLITGIAVTAEGNPPEPPNGMPPFGDLQPPQGGDMGTPPDGFGGGQMGEPPMGMPPEGMGGPGGHSKPEVYDAVYTYDANASIANAEIISNAADENAIHVTGGNVSISEIAIARKSDDSTGGDSASFYGVGAAVLTTGGTVIIEDSTIETDAAGGTGVFAYGDGIAHVSNCTINTKQGASGGIHVAGGGTLYANDLTVETDGTSAAAIRSDRGGGTMVVDGGSYTSNGSGSPAVYVTADITVSNADLTAAGSEALCLEGKNSVRLIDCSLNGNMPDQEQNDNTWTVIVYQSMSGDAQVGEGSFYMEGGTLNSENGGVFYTTNTDSVFTLKNVQINVCEDSEYLLRCTGNRNARGWGQGGANGANCTFNAINQQLNGDVIYDSISNLTMKLTEGSTLIGAILDDESCAGEGGDGRCEVMIDETSTWIVTGDSTVTTLRNAGTLTDAEGRSVSIIGADGMVYQQGESMWSVTVDDYI